MPLISCPDCGKEVSDQARACPNCARPIVTFTPIQREVAKNVAGMTSGCFWMIVGILTLILLPILVPIIVVIIVVPYNWIRENPLLAGLLGVAAVAGLVLYLRSRKKSRA